MSDVVGSGAPQARSKPPGTKRLRVILSFVCYLLLGLPVWWHTTDIHRAQLSQEAIADALQQVQAASLLLPAHLHVYVVSSDSDDPQADAGLWLQHLRQQLEQGGWREHLVQGRLQLQVSVESRQDSSCTAACTTPTGTCSPTNPSSSSSSSGTGCLLAWKALQHQAPGSSDHELDQALLDLVSSSQEQHRGGGATTTLGTSSSSSSSSSDLHRERAGHYTLFVLPQQLAPSVGTEATSSSRATSGITVGVHRHAWMWELPSSQAATTTVAPAAAAAAQAARQLLRHHWATHLGGRGQQGDAGSSSSSSSSSVGDLPISPAGELLLSFSLLHAGPAAAVFDWQFDQFEQQYLAPLQQALAPVAGVSVESQVAFFTRAKVNGSWSSSHDAWVVQSADLPFFVDSDWPVEAAGIDMAAGRPDVTHAHSSATRGVGAAARPGVSSSTAAEAGAHGAHAGSAASVPAHVLHFLVYIPPPEQQPLLLLDAAGQPSAGNSMWLPSWGGLLVVNPPVKRQGDRTALSSADDTSPDINSSSGTEHRPQPGSAWPPSPQQLRRHQQQHIARVVAGQLQALFGLVPAAASHTSHTRGSSSSNMSVQQLDPLSTGLSDWQVDQLVTQAVASQVAGAARVLGSLSKLLEELPNLETPDVIGDQVTASLASIQSALQAIHTGDYSAASAAARAARAAAESAFLHPAVLAQLNFPESHKLGVYMPLFLPLCVPVLKGLLLEAKRYMRHKRAWLSSGQ